MFQHILVTLDGSEYSERALEYARGLGASTKAAVSLLSVIGAEGSDSAAATRRRVAQDYLEGHAAQVREQGVSNVTVEVRAGEPAPVIAQAARELGTDLIIMSTQGLGAGDRFALGSVALHVLTNAPCPVLMVRINKPEPAQGAAEERWQGEGGQNVG